MVSLLLSAICLASEEISPSDPRVHFERYLHRHLEKTITYGPNLIYDCEKKRFACVNIETFQECQENRAKDLADNKRQLACAPLQKHEYLLNCTQEQQKHVDNDKMVRFCINQ